jgi:hypothetical protein
MGKLDFRMPTSKDDIAMVRRSTRYNHRNKRPVAIPTATSVLLLLNTI